MPFSGESKINIVEENSVVLNLPRFADVFDGLTGRARRKAGLAGCPPAFTA